MRLVKLRANITANEDTQVIIFIGKKGQTLQNAGRVLFRPEEWKLFSSALLVGAEQLRIFALTEGKEADLEVEVVID